MVMVSVMIYAIKNKPNGIGQKEFITFFYIYLLHIVVESMTVTNIVPTSSALYQLFAATHVGTTVTLSWCLFGNGLVTFQLIPDGERLSIMGLRYSSLGYIYRNGKSKWLIGDLLHGYCFYWLGLMMLVTLSTSACNSSKHYLDGLSLHAGFQLIAVMMLYKYWFALNVDDLEFEIQPLPAHMIPGPLFTLPKHLEFNFNLLSKQTLIKKDATEKNQTIDQPEPSNANNFNQPKKTKSRDKKKQKEIYDKP